MIKSQLKTMLHKGVDEIMDGWDVPEDEALHFFQHEDVDTLRFGLQELIDSIIYMAPVESTLPAKGTIHWIAEDGDVTVDEGAESPTFDEMKEYLKGYSEHVSVLFKGRKCAMFVNEVGRSLWATRNPTATEIYFAASRARGIDPENREQSEEQIEDLAERLGVPKENIVHIDISAESDQPPGIYGPAILLEDFE